MFQLSDKHVNLKNYQHFFFHYCFLTVDFSQVKKTKIDFHTCVVGRKIWLLHHLPNSLFN